MVSFNSKINYFTVAEASAEVFLAEAPIFAEASASAEAGKK